MIDAVFVEQVAAVIREVGATQVVPRFQALATGDISEKSPGDYVTIADQECERVLTERLRQIRDVPVVGEEATAADPTLLDLVAGAPAAWVIDPIDGTANFVAGKPSYVVMVAFVEGGETAAAWVWHPATDAMLTVALGGATKRNGVVVPEPQRTDPVTGILKRKYVPEPGRTRLGNFDADVGQVVPASRSAGIEYALLIDGEIDFLFYWRTLPWDHAPCALLAQQAGMRVARIDGSPYAPGDGAVGLLAAVPNIWDDVANEIRQAIAD